MLKRADLEHYVRRKYLIYQHVVRYCENCKTFMRRFDPDPRLHTSLRPSNSLVSQQFEGINAEAVPVCSARQRCCTEDRPLPAAVLPSEPLVCCPASSLNKFGHPGRSADGIPSERTVLDGVETKVPYLLSFRAPRGIRFSPAGERPATTRFVLHSLSPQNVISTKRPARDPSERTWLGEVERSGETCFLNNGCGSRLANLYCEFLGQHS